MPGSVAAIRAVVIHPAYGQNGHLARKFARLACLAHIVVYGEVMPKLIRSSEPEYITPTEASKLLYLSTKQLTRYADEGKIRYIRPGSHRRYLKADVLKLRKKVSA
jgi:excisionase family DNA binding protein